jgi:hypothetical protein
MEVAYARTPLPQSIFLAGPTPRRQDVKSWRPEALETLERLGFNGTVFVPEDSSGSARFSYDDQVEWELQALNSATCILFWVPREIETMPAFVTNIEFGMFCDRPNVVLGYPKTAEKMKYLHAQANLRHIMVSHSLEGTCRVAMHICNRPFPTGVLPEQPVV